jgi:hypothetical protein
MPARNRASVQPARVQPARVQPARVQPAEVQPAEVQHSSHRAEAFRRNSGGLRANRFARGPRMRSEARCHELPPRPRRSVESRRRAPQSAGRELRSPSAPECSRMPPPDACVNRCGERRASNDARATGRGSTPVRLAAHSGVGNRRARAAARGLRVVRIIRCRSFGRLLVAFGAAVASLLLVSRAGSRSAVCPCRLSVPLVRAVAA